MSGIWENNMKNERKEKCIVFGDSNSYITNILLRSLLEINAKYKYFDILFVVDTQKRPIPFLKKILKIFIIHAIKIIFNKKYRNLSYIQSLRFLLTDLYKISKKYKVKVMHIPNINSKEFLEILESVKPTVGILIGCPQIFQPPVISKFEYLINYHNSLLPKYKGLNATAWSIYFGEQKTGFTFHIVNENIDEGNILIQDVIEIDSSKSLLELEIEKTKKASETLKNLIMKIKNRDKGMKQEGIGSYFGKKEIKEITTIEKPENFTSQEIIKRLVSFEILNIKIGDSFVPVTDIAVCFNEKKASKYVIVKDACLEIKRALYMPVHLYKAYTLLKKGI